MSPVDPALVERYAATTVADVMIAAPTTHPADATVGDARASLARPKQHMVLLVDAGRLVGTLVAADLPDAAADDEPALPLARLEDRTARPEDRVAALWDRLHKAGGRRLAVVAEDGRLAGLVCLKRARNGFCTEDGIASWRTED